MEFNMNIPCSFWWDLTSNLLATFIGAILGILTALCVNRKIEAKRKSDTLKQNLDRIEQILVRILVPISNLNSKIEWYFDNEQEEFFSLYLCSLTEVDVISSLHKEISDLGAKWDVLNSLDITVSQIKALNRLLDINRDVNGLLIGGRISKTDKFYLKMKDELKNQYMLVEESIKEFRKTVFAHYPKVLNRIGS